MNATIRKQIEEVQQMKVKQLHDKYLQLFGQESHSNHRQFLVRRIAWRLQALAEGGLSERARRRAMEIANDADLRIRAPKGFLETDPDGQAERTVIRGLPGIADNRVPMEGTVLTREFKGKQITVRVLDNAFEYEGQRYRSLSAIASRIAGTRWNGFVFFGLKGGKEAGRASE